MALITKPVTLTAGTDAKAADINSIADTIYNDYNGNITNANVSASAGIVGSKLDLSAPGNIGATTPGTGNFTNLTAKTITANTISISCGAGTGNVLTVANVGTDHGNLVYQTGVLGASRYGLYVYSDVAQINAPLGKFFSAHVGSTTSPLYVENGGMGNALTVSSTLNSAGNIGAIEINVVNAGVGTGCAFSFNGDVTTAASITTNNSAGSIWIMVGGALKKIPYFDA